MYTDSKTTENENKKIETTIMNRKKIILLLKPQAKVMSFFVSTAPRIRILRCKIADSTKISKHTRKPRGVRSLPLFKLNNIKYNFFENNINEYNNYCNKAYKIKKEENKKSYKSSYLNYQEKPVFYTNYKLFRCQLNTTEETCCCSCNSDAMFEVMKSLYDCYKKKNCNNCNCILCGHLPREERRLGEKRKSEISVIKPGQKEKVKKTSTKATVFSIKGKSIKEKELFLKEQALQGKPLPLGKTKSEKELVENVRKAIGLPSEPQSILGKNKYREAVAAGIIIPLEGRSHSEKEKILREQAALGLPLPEGRSSSEKSLIAKIKADASSLSEIPIPSEKLKQAKAAGLLTPIKGKPQGQKENILKGLAMHGIPLPEAKTASEKKIIDKISRSLALPPIPDTEGGKENYKTALASGLITPLEGKTSSQKEMILREQAAMGLTLPEGRTKSEKSLIEKIKATTPKISEVRVQSQVLKKAKAAGLLTPLEGKTKEQKEKLLKGLAMNGVPLPEAKSPSEKDIIEKVRADIGLPPEPESPAEKNKYKKAIATGLIAPLEGKSQSEKENILRKQVKMGLILPEGRTSSEKALIAKVKETTSVPSKLALPSKKLKKAKAAGLLTPLEGKSKDQKENILKGLAMHGIPLPEAKTTSEKKIMDKVIRDLGLPQVPEAPLEKEQYNKAIVDGIITPLEGKTSSQKVKILRNQAALGFKLPEGRTSSEKALIAKVKASSPKLSIVSKKIKKLDKKSAKVLKESKGPSDECICGLLTPPTAKVPAAPKEAVKVSSEKIRKAKEAGFLTPLEGKPKQQREKILRGLAMQGLPLPDGKTPSDIELVDNVRQSLGLPLAPKTSSAKQKYNEAIAAGIITPLEGKTLKQKEKALREQAALGLPLPEGRTSSEKFLVAKIKAVAPALSDIPVLSKKIKKAKAAGLLTPLEGKTYEQKEKILKGLAMHGIPLPEAKTTSAKKILDKIRKDVGLPPVPDTKSGKEKYKTAIVSGIITPLEGKTALQKEKLLREQAALGFSLPEGRTKSEKSLIEKIKATTPKISEVRVQSQVLKKAKAAGLLTPLEGKTKEQKEKLLKGLAMNGVPLPEAKSPSEKDIIEKVRADIGLPPEPESPAEKNKYKKAIATGLIAPLEGKSQSEKENILRKQVKMGLTLPEGRTSSEKALITKVKETTSLPSKLAIPSKKLKKAKAAGLLTPLEGKNKEQREKILKGLAMHGIPLPEAKTTSEKKIMDKVIRDLGLPQVPEAPLEKEQYNKAIVDGIIIPLEGKTSSQKEKILRNQVALGLKLPKGRTSSEKALIAKIKASSPAISKVSKKIKKLDKKSAKLLKESKGPSDECICGLLTPPTSKVPAASKEAVKVSSEKIRKAKEAGPLTPLEGKPKQQREKILRGLAMQGLPLPDGKTPSDIELVDNVRQSLGLPLAPKTSSAKQKYNEAIAAGIITPLEGKTLKQKEKVLREQAALGLPLPEGRTNSEKSLVAKIKAVAPPLSDIPILSKKIKKAKAAGLLTPLEGKTRDQKENILKGLAIHGIPIPEGRTSSDKKIVDKVRADLGLPPPPETLSAKEKYQKAYTSGLITPLEGKSSSQKEKILKNLAQIGIDLPAGRTPSEKALIAKLKETPLAPSKVIIPSEKLLKAKAAGLITPIEGKPPQQKEKILKELAMYGIPLPEAKTSSEKKIINKVIKDIGLPPEPETPAEKNKYRKAVATGIIAPLEGKSLSEKENILRKQAKLGLKLPEGRTKSEKALIEKIKTSSQKISEVRLPSQVLKKAKAAGLLTPLEGKTKEQKEKILKGLAMNGIPLPEAKNSFDRKMMNKIRTEVGLPPVPVSTSERQQYIQAMNNGFITPLEGKTASQKEKVLRNQAALGLKLPEGRTSSEKALIAKIKASSPKVPKSLKKVYTLDKKSAKMMKEGKGPSDECICDLLSPTAAKDQTFSSPLHVPSEKLKKAKKAGYLTPLQGKSKEQKEKILKGLAMHGIPLPEAKSKSEKNIMEKIRADVGLPPLPKTSVAKEKYNKAIASGLITPLDGKTTSQKEKILRKQAELGLFLPEGRTQSEKSIVKKLKTEYRLPSKVPVVPEKDIIGKAKADGLLTPLKGKSSAQKEKIIKGLTEAGLPLPAATTASEKSLIEKVKASVATTSKKMKVKSKLKAGITESFEDVIKTTTCDKGCGCDKKKIKFKHSYVKIRVTSPDISSLCPCPDECVPGVKGGVFLDNEGIKVTVGRATATTVFSSKEITEKGELASLTTFNTNISTFEHNDSNHNNKLCKIFTKHRSDSRLYDSTNNSHRMIDSVKSISSDAIIVNSSNYKNTSSSSSLESRLFIETESSLGFITPSETMSNISLLMTDSSYDFNPNHQVSLRDKSELKFEVIHNKDSRNSVRAISEIYLTNNVLSTVNSQYSNILLKKLNHDVYALETTQSEIQKKQRDCFENFTVKNSIDENVQINEISRLVNRIITTELRARSSSFVILIPCSSDDISESSQSNISSSICMQVSKNYPYRCPVRSELSSEPCVMCSSASRGRENIRSRMISTDTTQDRPCCCNDLQNIETQNSYRCKKISFSSTPPGHKRGIYSSSTNHRPVCSLPKYSMTNKPDRCKITKMEIVRQTISVACGPDENFNINQRPKTVTIKTESPCSCCVKFDVDEHEKSSKPSNLCSCQEHSLDNETREISRTTKKSKNNICDCPEEAPEDLQPTREIDDEYLRLMQSDLTQTTSGFKLDVTPKLKSEMSFEDVLKYYYQQMEKEMESDKKRSRISKRNECECPEIVPDVNEIIHNERFKGIKIHIEGKGSGSRGLNGILCFELFEYAGQ